MRSAKDVASYILRKQGLMSTMKLQKLVYYAQAWHLVWEKRPLFNDRIEAWANGPVVPTLFNLHRGQSVISSIDGDPSKLSGDAATVIDRVLNFYGHRSPEWLIATTHAEGPWKNARIGYPDGARANSVITQDAMYRYYSSL